VLIPVGQVATFIYFGLFVLLPFISKKEEQWLRARGLPPELQALVASEEAQRALKKKGAL
jgi:hypothetical protein